MYRTKTCGELTIKNVEEIVELAGWIQKIRNLGGMEFIDLRDEFGITQIIISKRISKRKLYTHKRKSCGKKQQKFKDANR